MDNEEQAKEREKDKKHNGDGSPIMVGGGGGVDDLGQGPHRDLTEGRLSCIFGEGVYQDPEPGDDDKKFFKVSGEKIQTFLIYANGTLQDFSSSLPPSGECEIVVHATGTRDDVTFISQQADDGTMEFGIDMDTRRYKKNVQNDEVHEANEPSHINKIELNGTKVGKFSAEAECAVCVDYVTPDKSRCFTIMTKTAGD